MSPRPFTLLLLTMPGFGIETLRQLDRDARWPAASVVVGLIGRRPGWLRWAASLARLRWRDAAHRWAWLGEDALASRDARRWLAGRHYATHWLADDDEVRRLRSALAPELTLTISSRILFSPATLDSGGGDWLNVHPGLLPDYAGASPVPYMFADGVAGCTIHRLAVGVDAGAIIDSARLTAELGADGGTLLYEQLPRLAAERILDVLQRWRAGPLAAREQDARALRHRSAARLRRDRRLDWSATPERLVRWVRALTPFAPALLVDRSGHQRELRTAEVASSPTLAAAAAAAAPGTVLQRQGRRLCVACAGGAVWLDCFGRPAARVGDRLALAAQDAS